jgi:hypothetical protein
MDILKKLEISLEENDLEKRMTDENTFGLVKGMGFIEANSKFVPAPTPKRASFRGKDFFTIITCIVIGAALSYLLFNTATAVRDELRKIIFSDDFSEMIIESGTLAHLSGFDGKDGLPGEKGEPGPPGPMGGVNQGAFNGVSGWERRESEIFVVEPGNSKTVSMSCSQGKILLGGGYNAGECTECSGINSYPSSKNSWETTLDNRTSDQPADLKVYVICAEPTL